MTDKPQTFGLLINRHFDVSNNLRITVSIVRDDPYAKKYDDYIGFSLGSYASEYPKAKQKFEFGNFECQGQVYGRDGEGRSVIAFDPEYYGCYSVDRHNAERMLATLKAWERVVARWRKANPSVEFDPLHCFNLFAKFAGARWVVFRDYATDRHAYDKPVQRLSIDQGAYLYRQQVEKWKQEWKGNSWDFKRAS